MRPLLGRLGGYLPAAIALALPTVFIPTIHDSFILPRISIVIAGACLGAGVALLAPAGPGLGKLRWPLLAAAAAAILAWVFSISWPLSSTGSYTRYESLPVRLGYLGLFAVAVWLVREKRHRDWVVAAFVVGTAVACLWALVEWGQHVPYRPDGNLGNANLLGALIAMALPLAVASGFGSARFAWAWWIPVGFMVPGLIVSTSRSGGLGAFAGCLALVVFAFRRRLWVAVSLLASSVLLWGGLQLIVFGPLSVLNNDPPRSRLLLWIDALRMIAARPVTGWGEDATGLAFGRFLSADWAPGVTYDRTHSGILEIATTQGVLGLVALGCVLLVSFHGIWRHRFTNAVAALGAACIGYTVWVVANFDWAPATGVFWLLGGTAWSGVRAAEVEQIGPAALVSPTTPGPAFWRSGLAVALAVAAIGLGALPLLADAWYGQGRVDLSVRVDPLQARYHWALGQGLVAKGSVAQGVDEMRRAADLGETEPSLYVELGDNEAQLGRLAEARRHYRRALEIDPYYAPASRRLAAAGG